MYKLAYQKLVLIGATVLALVWAVAYLRQSPVDDPDWMVRLTLGMLLAFALLVSKPGEGHRRIEPGWFDRWPRGLPLLALGAAILSVIGVIVPIRQFEWLGLVFLLYAAVRWALPMRYRLNIIKAFFLFYWIHPLPGQIFGPFQLWMQRMSVAGAEWLLHALNHRLWADGFILRLGTAEFGVPEACSGMRTVVTVLLCTLGVGMLIRLRWHETVAFLALGTAQVLALNILRIGVIVHIATRSAIEVSETVLHDTAGIFLLISILVVQAEMVWWRSFSSRRRMLKHARAIGDVEPAKRSSFLPPFWRALMRSIAWILAVAIVVVAMAGALYKRRPSHRAEMIKGAAEILLRDQPRVAVRAVAAARALNPGDRELGTLGVQALVRDEQYEAALQMIETLPRPLNYMERAMQSSALAATGSLEEAADILEELPESVQRWPGLAVFRAEYAARVDDPATAAEYVRYAARSHIALRRVRSLYPYLNARGQWLAIADTHHPEPYSDLDTAILAVRANLAVNRRDIAGRVLRQTVERWPDDMRLLGSLGEFAVRYPDSDWENRFEYLLLGNLDTMDKDHLAAMIGYTFGMRRPDLAWRSWQRLAARDPADPALFLAAARHAGEWFLFRRRHVGMSAMEAGETVDMRDTYLQRRDEPGFQPHWDRVPLAEPMVTLPVEQLRADYLRKALEELKARELAGTMTPRLDRTYPVVLGMLGHTDEAHQRLDILVEAYPEMRAEVLFQHALNYERRAEWDMAYESLRSYFDAVPYSLLPARLMYINATLNAGLGQLAMRAAQEALVEFPDAPEARMVLAMVWDAFGFKEQALFVMSQAPETRRSPFYPQLLHDAGRFNEAARRARALGYRLRVGRDPLRVPRVVPAEFALRRPVSPPMDDARLAAAAERAARLVETTRSDFMRGLREREARWFADGAGEGVADLDAWTAVGRDASERAAAAYSLAALLLQQGDREAARAAVDYGLEQMPGCLPLWRHRVTLSDGDPAVVAAARQRFPDDPEFWLAELVVRVDALADSASAAGDTESLRDQLRADIEQAAKAGQFAPGDMVRAADFLLRRGFYPAAEPAARYAIDKGHGLETAYVIGLRCALRLGDTRWALSCVLGGADHALDPKPFYQMLVNLNFARGALDRDLVVALNYLQEQFPEETAWSEQLGFVHFRQGDPGRALSVLAPLVRRDDLGRVRVGTIALAAESARLDGRHRHAVSILEAGLESHPDDPSLLNNLVYTLAQHPDPASRERAIGYLPALLRTVGETAEVLDTIAVVYLRLGDLPRAERYLKKALEKSVNGRYAYPLIQATKAELFFARGQWLEGLRRLDGILGNTDHSDAVRREIRGRLQPALEDAFPRLLEQARQHRVSNEPEVTRDILNQILRSASASDDVKRAARRLLEQRP